MRDNSIPYVLTTAAATAEFDPIDPRSTMWFEDIQFSSSITAEITSRPQAHGAYMDSGFKQGGVLSATARLIGGGAQLEQNRTALSKALNSILGTGAQGALAWTNQGSTTPTQLTGLQLIDSSDPKIDGSSWVWHILLGSEKPFAEDIATVTSDSVALTSGGGGFVVPLVIPFTLLASTGGTVTVSNAGDFFAYPVLRVYGPITAPLVTNTTTGLGLSFTGTIAAGDFWEIDLFARSVRLNGVTSVTTIDMANSDWFNLGLGSSTLQLTGSAFSAATLLRVLMKSAWA